MSSDLERRLAALFAEAPDPEPGAGEEALHRSLRALHPAPPAHRGLRTAVLAFAAVVVLLVIAAGSLAAAGALHITIGAKPKPLPAAPELSLPKGADGIAALVGGRLSVVIQGGFRLQVPASAAALSPHARYVAAGIRDSLVALAPNGRRAWTHPTGGRVVAIAWRPDGLEIAYIVRLRRRLALHLIYGIGTHDVTIDRSVRAVRPAWRADSLALAYAGAGGKAIVYDLGHQRRRVLAVDPPVTGLAFAPTGDALAVQSADGVSLVHGSTPRHVVTAPVEAFGWLNGRLAVAVPGLDSALIRQFAPGGAQRGSYRVHGIVVAITQRHVVAQRGRQLLAGHTTVLTVPHGVTLRDLAIR